MKILPIRTINNNVFSTTIKPSEMGNVTMTAEEEIALLSDFPQILKYSDITFSDKFLVTNGIPEISTDPSAVSVSLALNNKQFVINENLEINISIDSNKIADVEVNAVLTNKELVAQAKVILFETKILDKIQELLTKARSLANTFETTVEQTL